MRVCPEPGCPVLVDKGRCPDHRRAAEQARGSKADRGYGPEHQHIRDALLDRQAKGETLMCARCGKPITWDEPWHLGHTEDRTTWTGPEHALCNLSAAGHARWQYS